MLNKKRVIILSAAAVFVLLLSLTIVNSFRLSSVNKTLETNRELLLSESAKNRETADYLNNINSLISYDLNRTRASLGLPVAEYPIINLTDDEESENSQIDAADKTLFNAVDIMLDAESENKKSAMLGRFLRNDIISEYILANKIKSNKISNISFNLEFNNKTFIEISASSEKTILLTGLSGDELTINSASNEAVYFINTNLYKIKELIETKSDASKKLYSIAEDTNILELLNNKIRLDVGENELFFSNIFNDNVEKAWISEEGYSISFRLSSDNKEYFDFYLFKDAVFNMLFNYDLRSDEEKLLDKAKTELEYKINDAGFQEYLDSLGLKLSTASREDNDYFYYDIFHEDGKKLGSFSILKKLGEIYLVDADEVPVSSLKSITVNKSLERDSGRNFIIPENIPQIEGLHSSSDTVTFLLVGNHEKNTDTMILAHADKTTGKAALIGIPRDLYWKGRKINSIYQYYGAEQFKKELSDITGLEINNYIIVDMYAFIDIVNILGGIEVTLEEDLIDPTYKTRENGEWSTLNYSKGTYNLNGVEALRVARSRHGSNDFERSKRQQLILEAFFKKLKSLKITDINKVYAMIQAMFEYVDTDFSIMDIMSIFSEYGDVELSSQHVLSFDNILYDTYSNIYMLEDKDMDFPKDFNKGAWILFPRGNDWNNIRWYIRSIINGEL